MRRRITLVQRPDSPFDLDQAVLSRASLSVRQVVAAREERVTVGLEEVNEEIQQVLSQSHQLHIRWASETQFDSLAPFSSRVAPGLHALFTPREGGVETHSLCALLKDVFDDGLKCSSPETSFISPPIVSTRFASTAAYQYHALLPSLDGLVSYIQKNVCAASGEPDECRRLAVSLGSVDSLDVNYDSISHALTFTAYWARSPEGGWTEEIRKHDAGTDKVEVGLLGTENAREPEDIKMGGLLGVVGEDEQLKPTLFSFPSRHHSLPQEATYSVSFPGPTGLHPTMTISIPRSGLQAPPAPADATCALHTYLTLPSMVFGDKYQLATTDPLFLDSHHLKALRAVAGETDLEAPDWFDPRWGSNWLLELATPDETDQSQGDWNATIPLHLRYLRPSESGYRTASVPWPIVFWACTTEEGTKMGTNPFDRVNLGWDSLFGPRTMFYQLNPSPKAESHRLVEDLEVPVLQLKEDGFFQGRTIELGTVVVITLGLLWVLWKLGLVVRSSGTGAQGRPRTDRQKKAQ